MESGLQHILLGVLVLQRGDGSLAQLLSSKRLRHTISVINLFVILQGYYLWM